MAFQRDFTTFYCYISEELLFGKDLYAGKDWISQVALVVKSLPANAGDIRDAGSIPGLGRSPEEEMATHSSILACRIPWAGEPGKR